MESQINNIKKSRSDIRKSYLKKYRFVIIGVVALCSLFLVINCIRTYITGKYHTVAGTLQYNILAREDERNLYLRTDSGKSYWLREAASKKARDKIFNFREGDKISVKGKCWKARTRIPKYKYYGPGGQTLDLSTGQKALMAAFLGHDWDFVMRVEDVKIDVKSWLAALKDKSSSVRREAERLAELGGESVVKPLITALKTALKDKDLDTQLIVILALGEIGDSRAILPLIAALKDENLGVQGSVLAENLSNITGEYFGEDSVKWQQWWKENKEKFGRGY